MWAGSLFDSLKVIKSKKKKKKLTTLNKDKQKTISTSLASKNS